MELLIFIEENKFVLYKDGRWYSTLSKWNKRLGETTYYEREQLLNLMIQHDKR